jgi:glutathione S-transferase
MLKLWGRINSINVQKVLWCLEEIGLPYERTDAGMAFGCVNDAWYRAMNPNGRVPVINDGGFVLWESNVIVRYLAAKHAGGTLYPEKLNERMDAERWMDWCSSTLGAPMTTVFWQLIRTPVDKRDMKAVADAVKACGELFDMLETHMAGRKFITGDNFTIGDIPTGCFFNRFMDLPIEHPPLPNLAAWLVRLKQRPGFQKHVALPLS